jgi:DNA-binding Xre family transcriptional regulator
MIIWGCRIVKAYSILGQIFGEGLMPRTRLKVKEIAQEKGWTQAKLGRAADINPRTMQGIYHDPYRDVAYSTLLKIAKVLGVEVADLIEEAPDE